MQRSAKILKEHLRNKVQLKLYTSSIEKLNKANDIKQESEKIHQQIIQNEYQKVKNNMKLRNAVKYHEQVVRREKIEEFRTKKSEHYMNDKAIQYIDKVQNLQNTQRILK